MISQKSIHSTNLLDPHVFRQKPAGVGVAHFVAVPSSAKVPPATVTAEVLVDSSLGNEAFANTLSRNGSFPVRASERSSHVIDGLSSGEAYDVFFVIEVIAFLDRHLS